MKKHFPYITAGIMTILLLILFITNPFDGCYTKPNNAEQGTLHFLLCFYYIVTAVWFFTSTKSLTRWTGAASGLLGCLAILIFISEDANIYGLCQAWVLDDPFRNYGSSLLQFATILFLTAFLLQIASVGILCGKSTDNKKARYVLFLTLICLAFYTIRESLPLMGQYDYRYNYGPGYYNDEDYSHIFKLYDSRENMQLFALAIVFISWIVTMLLYKSEENTGEPVAAPENAQMTSSAPVPPPVPQSPSVPPTPHVVPSVPPVPHHAAVPPVPPPVPQRVAVPPVPPPIPSADNEDATVIELAVPAEGQAGPTAGVLTPGTPLQFGRYQIVRTLGQGGFGITYLATQTGLNRKVAIKEFFMKEYCDRNSTSNQITLGTAGSKDMVAKFKAKFIKEAQTIAELQNLHVVRIYDIFEENGTAYYVMEYLEGGSLTQKLDGKPMDEVKTHEYIAQICNALQYIHNRNILHLDIKPSNILFRNDNELVLIDFGVSKHYDEEGGSQTSSTPVGISRGYAPLEQYNKGGVTLFSPATDIYSLGATLFTMVTGLVPPDANEIYEDGLKDFSSEVSGKIQNAITKAMNPKRKERPQSIDEFKALLED
jgi:predicted Ser/Thr protein kinase